MKQIEAFDILTISIQKYLIIAQKTGSRLNNLQIIAPCNPLNLQSLISEFDQLPNDSPRCKHLFERTGSILNNWNAFIALKKSDESLFYRLDEDYRIWRKSAGIDPEKWSEGNDYLFCTWDDVANIINEVNDYLRRKIGIKKSKASTTKKSKAGRPASELKPLKQFFKTEIPEQNSTFLNLLKGEFHASKSREIALMILALIKMRHLNEPANRKELLLSFTNYFGSTINYTQFAKDFKSQSDTEIVSMEKRIGNIKNKNGIK